VQVRASHLQCQHEAGQQDYHRISKNQQGAHRGQCTTPPAEMAQEISWKLNPA
jgi:hypothetical protein